MNKVNVLDHGYVRYDKHMGSDLDVVNSAKASYDKRSVEFKEREARLLAFLMREEHLSVLRHSAITYEVYAPLMVARQWFKYAVGSTHVEDQFGWNESSRRYITEEPTFYVPSMSQWREKPENSKQGSGDNLDSPAGVKLTAELNQIIMSGLYAYESAIQMGVAPEQARLFLPAYGMYVRWRWTASLASVLHFLHQRLADDAQQEIQVYAQAVYALTEPLWPATLGYMFPEGV